MNLQQKIRIDLRASMVGGNKELTSLLRVVLGEFSRVGKELTDEEALTVIKKMHKNAIELNNKFEVEKLEAYLPKELEITQTKILVAGIINQNKFSGIQDMGKVIGKLREHPAASQVNMKVASELIKELLR